MIESKTCECDTADSGRNPYKERLSDNNPHGNAKPYNADNARQRNAGGVHKRNMSEFAPYI